MTDTVRYTIPYGRLNLDQFVQLVGDMRASQKRWPSHPEQASIETMALEKRVDEALEEGIEPVLRLEDIMIGR